MSPDPPVSRSRKEILITRTFSRNLKKLRRHFREDDVIQDIGKFVLNGLRRGETELRALTFGGVRISILKLRLRVGSAEARYLLGVLGDREYLPFFIDLKTGFYGRNLSLEADGRVVSQVEAAIQRSLLDYLEHTDEEPRLVRFPIESSVE